MSLYVDYLNGEGVLQHHGVLGMKWGIRRYQPYPKGHVGGKEVGDAAKKRSGFSYSRELNKIAQKQAVAEDNRRISLRKGRPKDANYYKKTIDEGEREIKKIVGNARRQGYEVYYKDVRRDAFENERFAMQLLFGPLGNLGVSTLRYAMTGSNGIVEGKKYKVKKPKTD